MLKLHSELPLSLRASKDKLATSALMYFPHIHFKSINIANLSFTLISSLYTVSTPAADVSVS